MLPTVIPNEKLKKKPKKLKAIALGLFVFIWILINVFVIPQMPHWSFKYVLALLLGNLCIGIAGAYLYFLGYVAAHLESFSRYYRRTFWLLGLALLVVPFFFILHVPDSAHNWDFFQLYRNITTLKGASFSHLPVNQHYGDLSGLMYYWTYPNQQFYAILLNRFFGPMTNLFPPIWAMTFVGGLLTSASVLGMSRIVRLLSSEKVATLFNVAAFGFGPFFVFGALLYTDTATLPFVVFGLLFMLWALRKTEWQKRLLWWGLALVLIFVGYLIKPTVAIILVAALLWLVLEKRWRELLLVIPLALVLFVAVDTGGKAVIASEPAFSQQKNETYNLPLWHWVTMSFAPDNKTGGYNHAVLIYSMSYEGKAAKTKADQALLIKNLQKEGVSGVLLQLWRKIVYTWFNGDLNDFFYTYRHANPFVNTFFDFTTWEPNKAVGNLPGWLLTRASQMFYWFLMLPFLFYEIGLSLWKKRHSEWFILALSVVGLTGFLLLWEANSRYLYNFSPVLIALAVMGLIDFLSGRKKHDLSD
ncbi:MAG: glycosyltransferase family 39 protein [Streptococcaceae bacterium]|jgi:hypothetical protein|nr:glycosyltransferase family 39 protein [Streptococcaceae bacterium]